MLVASQTNKAINSASGSVHIEIHRESYALHLELLFHLV